ncbi:MAG: exodeoxyribonuclease VII large subunit [Actinomycetota bacterium]
MDTRRDKLVTWVPKIVADRILEVERIETSVRLLDPKNVLARGWSITRDAGGNVVRSVSDATPGTELRTSVADGTIVSTVTTTDES